MVRFSEREWAAMQRRGLSGTPDTRPARSGGIPPEVAPKPSGTPDSRWRCMTLVNLAPFRHDVPAPCGQVLASWVACERHARVHGVGARFECLSA